MSTRVQRYIVIKKDKNLAGSPKGTESAGVVESHYYGI